MSAESEVKNQESLADKQRERQTQEQSTKQVGNIFLPKTKTKK